MSDNTNEPAAGAQPPQPSAEPGQAPVPPQPTWAWAQVPQTQIVDSEPLEYHRLLRGITRYRWWKPLIFLVVAAVVYGVLTVLFGVAWVAIVAAQHGEEFATGDPEAITRVLTDQLVLDTQNPLSVAMSLLSVILAMIPAVFIGMLPVGARPLGRIWSVAARIRWGLLWRSLGIAVVTIIVTNLIGIGLGILMEPDVLSAEAPEIPEIDATAALISLALVLVLVPLQATAEEVAFRGMLMQVIGAWLRSPWFAILIPSALFAVMHIYDIWGMLVVGLMGVAAGWLTWRTGGLEAAMGIHIINNLFAFGMLATGVTGETGQTVEGATPAAVIAQAAGLALFMWLVTRSFRKHGYGRERIDRIEVDVPQPPQSPQPQVVSGA